MKYIKLFEDFNEEPDMYDALQIVITHLGEVEKVDIDPKWNTNNLIKLNRKEERHHTEVEQCEGHLSAERFFLYIAPDIVPGDFIIVGVGESIEDWCINWLNDNYGNLNIEEKDGEIYYIDKDRNVIIKYMKSNSGYYYINFTKVWSFFVNVINMKSHEIKPFISKWLKDKYNLSNLSPESGIMTTLA